MKKWIVLIVVIAALGVGIAARIIMIKRQVTAESIEKIQIVQGLPVRVFVTEPADLLETIPFSGVIEALQRVDVAATITERISKIHVQTGQSVTAGELLVTLDTAKSELAVAQAKASLARAEEQLAKLRGGFRPEEIQTARARMEEAAYLAKLGKIEWDRQSGLYEEDATELRLVEDAENRYYSAAASLEAARAQLELMEKGYRQEDIRIAETEVHLARVAVDQALVDLEDHYLRAFCPGIVTLNALEVGDILPEQFAIFQVVDTSDVYLVVDVSEIYIRRLSVGLAVKCTLDAFGNEVFTGTVEEINPVADSARAFRTKMRIDNSDGRLLPGMFGRAHIATRRAEQAIAVPYDSVLEDEAGSYVLVVDDQDIVQRVDVTLGRLFGNMVEVTSGLSGGALIVELAHEIISPGMRVVIAERLGRQSPKGSGGEPVGSRRSGP